MGATPVAEFSGRLDRPVHVFHLEDCESVVESLFVKPGKKLLNPAAGDSLRRGSDGARYQFLRSQRFATWPERNATVERWRCGKREK